MNKSGIAIFVLLISLLFTGAILQRHALTCDLLPVLNYRQINSEVFIGGDLTEPQIKIINGLIESAAERIRHVYGNPISKPRFVITTDIDSAASWGANDTASMHRMPWRACIIIGPKGQSVDVIAHEWLHAEIQYRVGFFRFLQEIPVWFDEGAALTLDYRKPFLPENINLTDVDIAEVKKLKNGRNFFSSNIMQHYQASRLAVEPLIYREQFFNDLEKIAFGESFDRVFLESSRSIQPTANASTD